MCVLFVFSPIYHHCTRMGSKKKRLGDDRLGKEGRHGKEPLNVDRLSGEGALGARESPQE
jgi:hypothetical protein